MRIAAHCLVKNEENFIWYAINSVIDYVDEIMVWDNGSSDSTVSVVKSIKNEKIKFREVGGKVSRIRQKMLGETSADWIFILDGDEIWWRDSIRDLIQTLREIEEEIVVVPFTMLIGDIFHYQKEEIGRYKIGGKVGYHTIRAIKRNMPGLHVQGVYPNEAYVAGEGTPVQYLPKEKILFLDEPYFHASFLPRSSKDNKKVKYEIGESFPLDFYYPEVFFKPRPNIVPSPWKTMDVNYKAKAFWQAPLKKIKRRII